MQKDERNSKSFVLKRSRIKMILVALMLFGIICLSYSCTGYDPSLYPGYDLLNPGPEVKLNPIRVTDDNNFVVNSAFLFWVNELKAEIKKLRKQLK